MLIDGDGLVVATGSGSFVGLKEMDERIAGALRHGRSYAGHEVDPDGDHDNFEFVRPVRLPWGVYAYEVSFDHHTFDAQLADLRRILVLIEVLTLLGGAGIFYLVGGRTLMQDHRLALDRANRDGLTGLPNQRAYHDELERAVVDALRSGEPLALTVLDLDEFKLANDRYGHPHGDELLRRVAGVLLAIPGGGLVYRIGGDEFALLARAELAETTSIAAALVAGMDGAGIPVSIGTANLRPGQSAESLHAAADAALYEAKHTARSRRHGALAPAIVYERTIAG
jgi:diguanylate cyclase (GGDEF)-like protein